MTIEPNPSPNEIKNSETPLAGLNALAILTIWVSFGWVVLVVVWFIHEEAILIGAASWVWLLLRFFTTSTYPDMANNSAALHLLGLLIFHLPLRG
jgi:hypothetical protein